MSYSSTTFSKERASFLSFKLGDEVFAAPIAKILEILQLTTITKVPKSHLYMRMDNDTLVLGALVDGVQEVLEISEDQIKPSPSMGSKYKSEFIEGMVKIKEEFIMILDIDKFSLLLSLL